MQCITPTYRVFQLLTHFFLLYLFFSKLYTQIQKLHTQNDKCLASLAKLSIAFKIPQTRFKSKHLSYVANTFAIILHFWIHHIHKVIQNLKLFFLLSSHVHFCHGRDVEEFMVNTKTRLKPNCSFTVSIFGRACQVSEIV